MLPRLGADAILRCHRHDANDVRGHGHAFEQVSAAAALRRSTAWMHTYSIAACLMARFISSKYRHAHIAGGSALPLRLLVINITPGYRPGRGRGAWPAGWREAMITSARRLLNAAMAMMPTPCASMPACSVSRRRPIAGLVERDDIARCQSFFHSAKANAADYFGVMPRRAGRGVPPAPPYNGHHRLNITCTLSAAS